MAFGITTFAEAPFSAQGQQNAVVAVSGQATTLALGSTTIGLNPTITGFNLTTALGNVSLQNVARPSGQEMTSAVGGVGISAGHVVEPAGLGASTALGTPTLEVNTHELIQGFDLTAALGTPSIEINAVATPSGLALTTALGTVTPEVVVQPSGLFIGTSLGATVELGDANVPSKGMEITKVVTVVSTGSGNKYFIDGVQQDTLELKEGNTYTFDQADASNSGHPLRFSTTSDGTHGGGTEYTTGVTTNGTPGNAGAYTRIKVADSAPTLYYYCTAHSGMGGQANTPVNNDFPGQAVTSALGTPVVSSTATVLPLGQSMSMSLGTPSLVISSVATPTGLELTTELGTPAIYSWREVDDSETSTWTEVDDSATMNWLDAA